MKKVLRTFKENKQFTLFFILGLVVIGVAIFAPQLSPYDPLDEKQKEKWIKKAEENISNELEQTDEDELYKISVSDDYTEVNCQVAQKANGLTFTAKLMIIFFNSEMYQILNGNAEWSIHVVAKDLSTGGELVNIDYPKEVFSITEETWDNL